MLSVLYGFHEGSIRVATGECEAPISVLLRPICTIHLVLEAIPLPLNTINATLPKRRLVITTVA